MSPRILEGLRDVHVLMHPVLLAAYTAASDAWLASTEEDRTKRRLIIAWACKGWEVLAAEGHLHVASLPNGPVQTRRNYPTDVPFSEMAEELAQAMVRGAA